MDAKEEAGAVRGPGRQPGQCRPDQLLRPQDRVPVQVNRGPPPQPLHT